MKALTLHQPWASLIALGVKTIETRSWATSYRGRLLIHAGMATPVQVEKGYLLTRGPAFVSDPPYEGGYALLGAAKDHGPYPLPRGAIVASCELIDVVQMGDPDDEPLALGRGYVAANEEMVPPWTRDSLVTWINPRQEPYGDFATDRYAWLLHDVKPTSERCPTCWGLGYVKGIDKRYPQDGNVALRCPTCHYRRVCAPVPAKGKQGLWNWEPDERL